MSVSQRGTLRDLLRRVDEVRGLSPALDADQVPEADDASVLIRTVSELVDELERSHRRLIETNVQLVSLREVASGLVSALDAGETTRTVARYLARAFGFEHAFLFLVNRESGLLEGTWTHLAGEREHSTWIELPLHGGPGSVARALWLNRTLVIRDPKSHPALRLPDGHPLHETVARLGSMACVPLQRHSVAPVGEPHELCGARCI